MYRNMKFTCLIFIIASFLLNSSIVAYSNSTSTVYLVSQDDLQLTLHSITDDLEINEVWQIPSQFPPLTLDMINDRQNVSASPIPSVESIIISPDGEKVAIRAFRFVDILILRDLFIYKIDGTLLGSYERIGGSGIVWSPDSQQLAINSRSLEIFDVNTGQFRESIDRDTVLFNSFGQFGWINNHQIAFSGTRLDISTDSPYSNIYLVDTKTEELTLLTNLTELPEWDYWQSQQDETGRGGWDSICGIRWSESLQRIYYVVGCPFSVDNSSLYSVDLEGNSRLEVSLNQLYPDARSKRIHTLHLGTDATYVFTRTWTVSNVDESSTITWRLFKATPSFPAEIIFEETTSTGLNNAAISPNGERIAFFSYVSYDEAEQIQIMNLATGEIIASPVLDNHVCNLSWLTDDMFIYSASSVSCGPSTSYRTIHVFDLQTNTHPVLNDAVLQNPTWLINPETNQEDIDNGETYWDRPSQ